MNPAVPALYSPVRLASLPASFDHSDFIFELKYDGFRAVAHVEADGVRLVSGKANVYKSFSKLADGIATAFNGRSVGRRSGTQLFTDHAVRILSGEPTPQPSSNASLRLSGQQARKQSSTRSVPVYLNPQKQSASWRRRTAILSLVQARLKYFPRRINILLAGQPKFRGI